MVAEVRRRWMRRERLGAWTAGAAGAATLVGVGALTVWLLASEGLALAFVTLAVVAMVAVTLGAALRAAGRAPTDLQLARYIEEQAGGLDDLVVTAVQHGDSRSPLGAHLAGEAAARVHDVGLDRIVSPVSLRRAALGAAAATLVLVAAGAAFAPTVGRGAAIVAAYLLPSRLVIDVAPGTAKVRAGHPVTITVRVRGLEAGLVPELQFGAGERPDVARMVDAGDGTFSFTFDRVTTSFPYFVTAGPARSGDFVIEAIRPARVRRIDLRYRYPEGLGLEPRVEEDGGDVYGPAGTRVELTITTDKPVTEGALTMADGGRVALGGEADTLTAELPITADGSYRVALTDVDGLENPGDTEYFIRMLDDRPPDVRVMRPGGDKQVSPLEEVLIEARADDDFGLASLEIVFQVPGQKDTVVPIETRRATAASGQHLMALEELGVAPGDFVTYYARARDVGQGRRGTEARSDIYFLEVKPFEEAFRAAQSQGMGMQGDPALQELAEAQKEIIAATWKLDARARRARDAKSSTDIKAVAQAQRELRARAAESAGELAAAMADPRRRRPRPGQTQAPGGDDPLARAVEAMGRAAGELDRLRTAEALPHEMAALEQLLKADSDVKERQVARQQQGGGGGSNRQTPDLSTLFDQQLRKQQETNYETPNNTETREEQKPEDDPLARVRELARRQEALQKAQQDLARSRDRLADEEIKRQLERLTREQQQLTEQADELSRQLQRASQARADSQAQSERSPSSSGQRSGTPSTGQQGGGGESSASSRQLREIAEQMRGATSELRRQDPDEASARSGQAAGQLRELSRRMEQSRPDERRRATGDLQYEARQIADAERRLATEADRLAGGGGDEQARRRLAAEQERLAERTGRLQDSAQRLGALPESGGTDEGLGRAAREAAESIERDRLPSRMREAAEALRRDASSRGPAGESRELARALDRIAGDLGAAAGTSDAETERLSAELARAGELRDRISELQQALQELEREARQGESGSPGQPGQQGGAPGSATGQSADATRGQPGGRPSSDAQGQPTGAGGAAAGTSGRGPEGGQAGADGSRLASLRREAETRLQEAQRLAGELRRQNPEMRDGPSTPADWYPSLSAPGTEAFKQDFSRWESLKQNLLLALERTEARLAGQLRERETRERLNAGGHDGVSDSYREMVDRYYEALASPRKPPR